MFFDFLIKIINPIIFISLVILLGIMILLIISDKEVKKLRIIALFVSCITFLISLVMWILFNSSTSFFQFSTTLFWVPYLNINYILGIDGISLFFIVLTTFLIIICILISWSSINYFLKEYLICFLILEFCLIQVFSVLDLILFYIFFESVLIPMFLIIGIWGSRNRKLRAAYQFFIYTLIGSFFMLISIVYIYLSKGTTDLQILWFINFTTKDQLILWLAFFISLAVKIPMIPFHIWLPEAHAEAPTGGSVILAGVLLKLGGYGFLRFSLPLFPYASIYYSPIILVLSILAVIYGSLTTLRQIDLKKIIAYSSISHMGFVTLGIFSLNIQGIEGSLILMLSHGLVSSALFLCVGILYDRYKTRILKYYGGLVMVMPVFIIFFIFFSFANIGFPGTSSFVGEVLILLGIFHLNIIVTFFAATGIILSAGYSIWLVNRISFSYLVICNFSLFQDVSRREFYILFFLTFFVLWMGLLPNFFLSDLHFTVLNLSKQFF